MSEKCPYCKDAGQIRLSIEKSSTRDRNGNKVKEYSYYTCFCVNNRFISREYNQLSGIPDITPRDALNAGKVAGFRNLLIFGHILKFYHLLKATMVLHANYHRSFEILNGYEIVKKYYVEQTDKSTRSLLDLEDKDLLVFSFDSTMENKAQDKVILDVIKKRITMNNPNAMAAGKKIRRPTWIYSPTEESFKESKEYSEGIGNLINNFVKIDLNKYTVPFKITNDFGKKAGIDINLSLGN